MGVFHGGACALYPTDFYAVDGVVSARLASGAHTRLPDFAGDSGGERVFLRQGAGRGQKVFAAVRGAEHQRVLGGLRADGDNRRVLCAARGADEPVRGHDGAADAHGEGQKAGSARRAAAGDVRADGRVLHPIPVLRDDPRRGGGAVGVYLPERSRKRAADEGAGRADDADAGGLRGQRRGADWRG